MFRRILLISLLVSAPSWAAAQAPTPDTFVIRSAALSEDRRINVHTPAGYDLSSSVRFPVLYMPDGGLDEDFPHIVRAVDSLTAIGLIPATIVVGVPNTERRRDLTGPTRIKSDSAVAPHIGGSAAFRRFFRDELIPSIDKRYRTTSDRAVIGESLAGLFIVETFLREPALFDRYIAFDPSLWWNKGSLADSARAFVSASRFGPKRLFVANSRDDIDNQTTHLAEAFRAAAPKTLSWTHESHPELTHATIFAGLESRGLIFGLQGTTRSTRRASIVGGATGAIVGALASAGYILNATAYNCVTEVSSGSRCSKQSHVVLNSTVITAGAVAGAAGGAWIGRHLAAWWR